MSFYKKVQCSRSVNFWPPRGRSRGISSPGEWAEIERSREGLGEDGRLASHLLKQDDGRTPPAAAG